MLPTLTPGIGARTSQLSMFLHPKMFSMIELKFWYFPFAPPPSLVCPPPNARAVFLHNDLLCNGMCSINVGAQTEKV